VQQLENVYVHYDVMMLEYIQYRSLPSCNSIKTIELSTLYYSTIPHSYQLSAEKHVHQRKQMLSIKNSNMLMISVSENFLVESEWYFTKYYLSLPSARYLYLRLPFS
jgi:hypothetical protein